MKDLIRELRRRHVIRAALLYLGGGWAAMEATSFFVENYGWSTTVRDVVVLLLALGLPAALIIAWYHGAEGRQALHRTEASLLLTLAVLAAIGTYRLTTAGELAEPSDGTDLAASAAASRADLGEGSVAVLPFVNGTGVDSLDWMGPGLSDMLTTNLAQMGPLTVVSPQRLFELLRQAGREETEAIPQELAMELASRSGARTMVYGSIHGTPGDLAVDAQLIDLSDGTIIGAERVRGDDLFSLADSTGERLARRLGGSDSRLALGPPEKTPVELTGDLGKLREFQLSLRDAWARLDEDSLAPRWRIVEMLEEVPGREREAKRALEELVRMKPDDPAAWRHLARISIVLGESGADTLIRRYSELERDPVEGVMGSGRLLEQAGRYEEARSAFRRTLELSPGHTVALDHLARTHLMEGNPARAREELESYSNSPDLGIRVETRLLTGDAFAWESRFDEALRSYRAAEREGETAGRPDLRADGLESALYIEWLRDPAAGFSRLNSAIWTLLELGRGEKALDLVEAAERLYVKYADRLIPVEYHALLYAKGRAYELLGASVPAARAYGELIDHWGDALGELPLLADVPARRESLRATPAAGTAAG